MKHILSAFFISLFYFPSIDTVQASCGLEFCPVRHHQQKKEDPLKQGEFQFPVNYRYVEFDIGGRGAYHATFLQPQYAGENYNLSVLLPVVVLDRGVTRQTGLSNPLLMGEYIVSTGNQKVAFGTQLELPLSETDSGISETHFMPIPYITWISEFSKLYLSMQGAFMFTLGAHSHGVTHVRYFNPHSNQEILYRSTIGYNFGLVSSEIYANGRQVTDHDATGDKSFMGIGSNQRFRVSEQTELSVNLEIPILSRSRELLRAGAGMMLRF